MSQLEDTLAKVDDNFNVTLCANGFMVEINGRDHDDEWAGTKVICASIDDLVQLINEAQSMERS